MLLHFTKMQGLGNDFVVIDAMNQEINLTTNQIQWLADRHYGIGCDQLLLLEAPRTSAEDFFYRIFNANGSEVAQCGNGVRCLARFIAEQKLSSKTQLRIATKTTCMEVELIATNQVRVNMGAPILMADQIPVQQMNEYNQWVFQDNNQAYTFTVLSMGNPHAVTWVTDIAQAAIATVGAKVSTHHHFPEQTNVGFMKKVQDDHIQLRVYERHAGETLACGSGACAAVVAGILQQALASEVTVSLPGGDLTIAWQGETTPVWMTGPADLVFTGSIVI